MDLYKLTTSSVIRQWSDYCTCISWPFRVHTLVVVGFCPKVGQAGLTSSPVHTIARSQARTSATIPTTATIRPSCWQCRLLQPHSNILFGVEIFLGPEFNVYNTIILQRLDRCCTLTLTPPLPTKNFVPPCPLISLFGKKALGIS